MNRPASSKFVPGLPDDDIDTQTKSQGDNSIKIYDGVADCPVNDSDTFKNVKIRAKDLAIQKVQQKIADYVYGFWKDRYLTLPDDEVLSIASEICTITDVKYNFIDSDDNTLIRATVLAQIDDNDVMNYIIQFFKERNELKIQNEALRKENEDLKRQIAELTTPIITKDKISLFNQKYHEADRLYRKKDYKGAIKLYNEAIQLNPNIAITYYNRRNCYRNIGDDEKARADFKKLKELGW
ncbi:MAG: tetratricopeptide repeat protein [Selenomonadaceae bacterium]|nr:tetratricopeptide repeat protein [Selenomonadaceae bacterium]